jgi:hypothetical protein
METWRKRWPAMKTGRSYHGKPSRNIHPHMRPHQSRTLISTIKQLSTGHGYTRSYLSRIPSMEIESPACTCGYHHQTSKHLLLECKLYNTECFLFFFCFIHAAYNRSNYGILRKNPRDHLNKRKHTCCTSSSSRSRSNTKPHSS